jgi:hypothetical protein
LLLTRAQWKTGRSSPRYKVPRIWTTSKTTMKMVEMEKEKEKEERKGARTQFFFKKILIGHNYCGSSAELLQTGTAQFMWTNMLLERRVVNLDKYIKRRVVTNDGTIYYVQIYKYIAYIARVPSCSKQRHNLVENIPTKLIYRARIAGQTTRHNMVSYALLNKLRSSDRQIFANDAPYAFLVKLRSSRHMDLGHRDPVQLPGQAEVIRHADLQQ